MSFGEHLDELRSALWKAVLALALGFAACLYFAPGFVDYVQTPLRDALGKYYLVQERARFLAEMERLAEEGYSVPEDLEAAAKLWIERGLITEEHMVDKQEFGKVITQVRPDLLSPSETEKSTEEGEGPALEESKPSDFITFKTYHRVNDDPRLRVIATGSQDAFMVYMKAALVMGAVVASPAVFYFIWQFVGAGLYPHEKHYVRMFGPMSLGLFLAGALLAFYWVMPLVLNFLLGFNTWMGIHPEMRITEWLSFVLILPIGFGVAFQLPLVMLFLNRIGIFSIETYISKWRIAVLVIFIVSMFLTPADPGSLLLMACPLTVLYFGGILLCKWMPRPASPFAEMADA